LNKTAHAIGWCYYHGKLLYTTRKLARKAARAHPHHKNAYSCEESGGDHPGMFHIGELPLEIRQGHVSRDEYYGGII
jgi:hypothetical protein